MNEPKNFEEFKRKQADNERTFDLHTEMLKEISTTLDSHTVILTGLQSDITSIKTTMATYEAHFKQIEKMTEMSYQNQQRILEKQTLVLQLLQQNSGE
jgi:hypothetical protein